MEENVIGMPDSFFERLNKKNGFADDTTAAPVDSGTTPVATDKTIPSGMPDSFFEKLNSQQHYADTNNWAENYKRYIPQAEENPSAWDNIKNNFFAIKDASEASMYGGLELMSRQGEKSGNANFANFIKAAGMYYGADPNWLVKNMQENEAQSQEELKRVWLDPKMGQFNATDMFADPKSFFQTQLPQMLGGSATLMAAGMGIAKGFQTGVMAIGAAGAPFTFGGSAVAAGFIGGAVASAISRPIESLMEGYGAFDEAYSELAKKYPNATHQQLTDMAMPVFNKTFDENMQLQVLDAVQIGLSIIPVTAWGKGALSGTGAIGRMARRADMMRQRYNVAAHIGETAFQMGTEGWEEGRQMQITNEAINKYVGTDKPTSWYDMLNTKEGQSAVSGGAFMGGMMESPGILKLAYNKLTGVGDDIKTKPYEDIKQKQTALFYGNIAKSVNEGTTNEMMQAINKFGRSGVLATVETDDADSRNKSSIAEAKRLGDEVAEQVGVFSRMKEQYPDVSEKGLVRMFQNNALIRNNANALKTLSEDNVTDAPIIQRINAQNEALNKENNDIIAGKDVWETPSHEDPFADPEKDKEADIPFDSVEEVEAARLKEIEALQQIPTDGMTDEQMYQRAESLAEINSRYEDLKNRLTEKINDAKGHYENQRVLTEMLQNNIPVEGTIQKAYGMHYDFVTQDGKTVRFYNQATHDVVDDNDFNGSAFLVLRKAEQGLDGTYKDEKGNYLFRSVLGDKDHAERIEVHTTDKDGNDKYLGNVAVSNAEDYNIARDRAKAARMEKLEGEDGEGEGFSVSDEQLSGVKTTSNEQAAEAQSYGFRNAYHALNSVNKYFDADYTDYANIPKEDLALVGRIKQEEAATASPVSGEGKVDKALSSVEATAKALEDDIERRRQEALNKANKQIEKTNKKEDRRLKVETYRTLDIGGNPVEVEITTNADGSRLLRARQVNEDGSIEPMAYVTERINNKSQATLTNEKLIEGYIGNEDNTLQRTNVDENPNQTHIDKINAKYDAELAALEQPTVSGKEVEQQVKDFGVGDEMVKPVTNVVTRVFEGLKKTGLTTAKTVGDWVGIGKGEEKPYSLKINGKDVQVKNVQPEVVNGFYSPLEKIVNDSKFDKLPAKQWIEKYANSEEAKWTGLKDWLAQQQGSVSKADIQQYLKDNRIQVVEVVKGEVSNFTKDDIADVKINQHGAGNWVVKTKKDGTVEFPLYKADDKAEAIEYALEQLNYDNKSKRESKPKFQSYQLEGEKENYKELLVTLPNDTKSYYALRKEFSDYSANKVPRKSGEDIVAYQDRYKKELEKDKDYQALRQRMIDADKKQKEDFKSTHFDEPNILVHLRMNTRTDADGNKVLFLEEIQSDWGQKGKKEGFANELKEGIDFEITKRTENILGKKKEIYGIKLKNGDKYGTYESRDEALKNLPNVKFATPSAPFVTDTNAWTKLAFKVALKEAVKQGADKIAWTTGEQQNDRYDLSKQVQSISYEKKSKEFSSKAQEKGQDLYSLYIETKESGYEQFDDLTISEVEGYVGKDIANKIQSNEGSKENLDTSKGNKKVNKLTGIDLKVGGKGMKGFYGSPTEGSLGIVGNVAKSLFKQEVGTVEIQVGHEEKNAYTINEIINQDSEIGKMAKAYDQLDNPTKSEQNALKEYFNDKNYDISFYPDGSISKIKNRTIYSSTQHSIDITPELKASVEGGQPLFKDAEAQYRIESGKNIIEAIKDFDGSPRATVALTHEIMHPTVVAIIDGAKEGNEVGQKHTETIVNEYNKATGQKLSTEDLIKGNDDFKNGTTSKQYRAVQEFIAKSWEKYHKEGGKGFSAEFQKVLDQITKAFQSVYKSLTGKQLTPELRKMFDEILGKEEAKAEQPTVLGKEEGSVGGDVESKAKEIVGESAFNKLKKEGYTVEKGKFDSDSYASFFGLHTGVQAAEFEKAGLRLVKPSEKIKVYRGKGKNVAEGENEGITWVAEDKKVAENYSGDGQVEEIEISKPKNPFPNPTDTIHVKGSDVGNKLRLVRDRLFKEGKLTKEQALKASKAIDEFVSAAGEESELYSTKTNKKGVASKYVKALQALGFDGIVQKESYNSGSPFTATKTGNETNTYGIFKEQSLPTQEGTEQPTVSGKQEIEAKKADIERRRQEELDNVKPVYHHTQVKPEEFNFSSFQRGSKSISQFGDGLNASSNTTSFLVNRYGNPIQGEVNDKEFVEIDANKTEKEIYEYLKSKGYKFSQPASEYTSNEKANNHPAIIELFQDFQKSNPGVKGVKVSNHIIGGQKVTPFYVIYDSKSFYGQNSLKKQINAKYDAELTALEKSAKEPSTVSGKEVGSGGGGEVKRTAKPISKRIAVEHAGHESAKRVTGANENTLEIDGYGTIPTSTFINTLVENGRLSKDALKNRHIQLTEEYATKLLNENSDLFPKENTETSKVETNIPTFENAKNEYDAVKEKYAKHLKKDGGLRANTPDNVKKEIEDAYTKMQSTVKQEREKRVSEDKRDTGLIDGIERIKDNASAFTLVKMVMNRGVIPERQYNDFGKNLLHIIADAKDSHEVTMQTAEIIQDFSKRANVKVDDTLARELQAAENLKYEPVEQSLPTQEVKAEQPNVSENPALANVEATAKALEGVQRENVDKFVNDFANIDIPFRQENIQAEMDSAVKKQLFPNEKTRRKYAETIYSAVVRSSNFPKILSEAYHKAKSDGSNPELVKAVEELLDKPKETSPTPNSKGEGTEVKYQIEESRDEPLASVNPALAEYIRQRMQRLFPSVALFSDKASFEAAAKKVSKGVTFSSAYIGAAIKNMVYVDAEKALQHTEIHEYAHIYWDALPADHPLKTALLDKFGGNEEAAIDAIGRAGTIIMENELDIAKSGFFEKWLKKFWAAVKGVFTSKSIEQAFAERLLTNADEVTEENITSGVVKYMKMKSSAKYSELSEKAVKGIEKIIGKKISSLTFPEYYKHISTEIKPNDFKQWKMLSPQKFLEKMYGIVSPVSTLSPSNKAVFMKQYREYLDDYNWAENNVWTRFASGSMTLTVKEIEDLYMEAYKRKSYGTKDAVNFLADLYSKAVMYKNMQQEIKGDTFNKPFAKMSFDMMSGHEITDLSGSEFVSGKYSLLSPDRVKETILQGREKLYREVQRNATIKEDALKNDFDAIWKRVKDLKSDLRKIVDKTGTYFIDRNSSAYKALRGGTVADRALADLLDMHYKYESAYGGFSMEKGKYRVPVARMDFGGLAKKFGFKEGMRRYFAKPSKYDNVIIDVRSLGLSKPLMTLKQARQEMVKGSNAVYPFQMLKLVKKVDAITKEAYKQFNSGRHANGDIVTTDDLSGSRYGVNFVKDDESSEDLKVSMMLYHYANIENESYDLLSPYSMYIQKYLGRKDKPNMLKWVKMLDDDLIKGESPTSNLGVYAKYVQALVNYTHWLQLGFNIAGMPFNAFAGFAQSVREIGFRNTLRGLRRVIGSLTVGGGAGVVNAKAISIMEKLHIVSLSKDLEMSVTSKIGKGISKIAFLPVSFVEYINHAYSFIGAMDESEWERVKALPVNASAEDYTKAMGGNERIDELHTLTQKINGAYSKYSRRGINKTAEGRALMQFKNWLPDVIFAHLTVSQLNEAGEDLYGEYQSGIATSVKNTVWNKTIIPMFKDKSIAQAKKNWETLSEHERMQVGKAMRQLVILGGMALWIASLDDRDDKELKRMLKRAMGDVTYIFDVSNMQFLFDNTVPVFGTIKNLLGLVAEVFSTATGNPSVYEKRQGSHMRGDLKLPVMIENQTPVVNKISKLVNEKD